MTNFEIFSFKFHPDFQLGVKMNNVDPINSLRSLDPEQGIIYRFEAICNSANLLQVKFSVIQICFGIRLFSGLQIGFQV